MATDSCRLNLTVTHATKQSLSELAKRRRQSISSLAKSLIVDALERQEDFILSEVAIKRDNAEQEKKTHDEAWEE